MKNLENAPKNHPFQVPDGYFDRLPAKIQSRLQEDRPVVAHAPFGRYAWKLALPVVLVMVAAVFYLKPFASADAETMLASIETQDLVAYLEQSDLTTEELLESIDAGAVDLDVDALEEEVYMEMLFTEEELEGLSPDLTIEISDSI
jgi:hypothetical protein